jgi:hypothetical protein
MSTGQRREIANQRLITLRSDELPDAHREAARIEDAGGQVLHIYGPRVLIGHVPPRMQDQVAARPAVLGLHAESIARTPARLSEAEELGIAAWNLRQSPEYDQAKAARPRDGEPWDGPDMLDPPDGAGMRHVGESGVLGAPELATEDMSPYLIGSVAVGIVIVEGPTLDLQFSDQERAKVVAEVQEGLSWLGRQEPRASITWAYDIRTVRVTIPPDPTRSGYEPLESLWRDPAMGQLGFAPNFQGVRNYVASIRTNLGTRWGYVGFFTKYPVHHFAYAAKPRLVMHYQNDGWGPDNIDRVFTHETGHIFGCPDEYSSSGCTTTARYGHLQEVNGNCQNGASPFTECLMAANTWAMCRHTPVHLGWRDSDGDGTLDPVDPLTNPPIDWRQLCQRFPFICELLGLQGASAAATMPAAPAHESIPLFLLRRVLNDQEMARVQEALAREQDQYIDALIKKLTSATKEIRAIHKAQRSRPRGRRRRS